MADETNSGTTTDSGKALSFRNIYLKDVSFESPNAPQLFIEQQEGELKSGIKSLATNTNRIADDLWEVVQSVTVEAKFGDNTAFLCEVQQAGIFEVKGFGEEETRRVLGGYCPGLIFPYTREIINNLVTKGAFPALLLPVLNFDDLYMQQLANSQQS